MGWEWRREGQGGELREVRDQKHGETKRVVKFLWGKFTPLHQEG